MQGKSLNPGVVMLRRMERSYPVGLAIVLVVALITHLPTTFGELSTDDYLIRAMVAGDAGLRDQGFDKADPDKSLARGLSDAFHFYSPQAGTLQAYQDYGNLPWWAGEEARMNPWRPLSALTHWLDYRLGHFSFPLLAAHSLLYLLLFAWFGYRLFWRLSSRASVAVLAALLLTVDYSLFLNFNWIAARNVFIAGALGCAMLEQFLLWRQQGQGWRLALSLVLFAAGLLSAESSIALAGYLFAYLWLVERPGWQRLLIGLLPFALVVVCWRLAYNLMGYGADGISLYVDPVHSPLRFLQSLAVTLPNLLMAVVTSVETPLQLLASWARGWLAALAAAIIVTGLYLARKVLARNPRARFMLVGSVLAAVPASALLTAGPRGGVFITIGFFWVLALWLHHALNAGRALRWLAGAVLVAHLFLPGLASFLLSSQLLPVVYVDDQKFQSVAQTITAGGEDRALLVINNPAPNQYFYLPFEWQFEQGVVPRAINQLAPGLVSFDLTRVSQRRFVLEAPRGLPLSAEAPLYGLQGQQPFWGELYSLQMLQGLFTAPQARFPAGSQWQAGDMKITVQAAKDGRPTRLRIDFARDVDPDTMAWQWYHWGAREYRAMDPLRVGESRFFAGSLDMVKTGDRLQLCVNCATGEES